MSTTHALLPAIGRVGIGAIFIYAILLDLKSRKPLFNLMKKKGVPLPWLFYVGAIIWKGSTGIALVTGFHTFAASILLAIYILIATVIFYDFWAAPKNERDYTLALFLIHIALCFGLLAVSNA